MRQFLVVCVLMGLAISVAGCAKKNVTPVAAVPEGTGGEASALSGTSKASDTLSTAGVPAPWVVPTEAPKDTAVPGAAGDAAARSRTDVVAAPPPVEEPVRVAGEPSPVGRTYVVRKGDTLYGLARRFYSNPGKWRVIYAANRSTLRDPNHIYVGQVLTIPSAE